MIGEPACPHPRAAPDERGGLPEDALVLCCFNNTYKIGPSFFDISMRSAAGEPSAACSGWSPPTIRPCTTCAARPPPATLIPSGCTSRALCPTHSTWRACRLCGSVPRHPALSTAVHHRQRCALECLPFSPRSAAKLFVARMAGSLLQAIGLPRADRTRSLALAEQLALQLLLDLERLAGAACNPASPYRRSAPHSLIPPASRATWKPPSGSCSALANRACPRSTSGCRCSRRDLANRAEISNHRRDCEALRRRVFERALMHVFVGSLQLATETLGIEQRRAAPVDGQTVSQHCQLRGRRGQLHRPLLVIRKARGHQLRQSHGTQQAARHADRESLATAGQHRQPGPQGVADGSAPVEWKRVEK